MYHLNLATHENEVLSNTLNVDELQLLKARIDSLGIRAHYTIFSSGTTGGPMKGYSISREALLKNAHAVNQRLALTGQDKWGLCLPAYHIGGLAVYFRAWLLGHSPVILRPWDPVRVSEQISKERVTVISLVPTQLYDLVRLKLRGPETLRCVLIGGDFLSEELAREAKKLGWPIVRTFGMSEVSSQLCTGEDSAGNLIPLPLHQIKIGSQGQLLVKTESLFSYLIIRREENWKVTNVEELKDSEGFYALPDKAELINGGFRHLGRLDESVKTSGHLVDLRSIREVLEKLTLESCLWGEMEVKLAANPRSGMSLILHHTSKVSEEVIAQFRNLISPVKIDDVICQDYLLRTELGKLKFKH